MAVTQTRLNRIWRVGEDYIPLLLSIAFRIQIVNLLFSCRCSSSTARENMAVDTTIVIASIMDVAFLTYGTPQKISSI